VTACPSGPRAVIFDLYGTLIDIRTDEDDSQTYAILAKFLAYLGVSITPVELAWEYQSRVRFHLEQRGERFPEVDVAVVFRDILTAFRRPHPDGSRADLDASEAIAAAVLFRTLTRRQFSTIPDVHQVLERLASRYRLGLVSDAQWVFTDPELEIADLARFFPVRVLSSRVGVRKPSPRPFIEAMRALEVAPEASIYVGDNPARDLVGARNAGMRCVIFRGENVQCNGLVPDACFQTYADLEAILDDLFDR
jgi:putative hydrolase of the HAD superfamily